MTDAATLSLKDLIYQLLSEGISGDPTSANNGALAYNLDPVGNRTALTSTLAAPPAQSFTYDVDDRLNTDTYDANGNTLTSAGVTYGYEFEDRLTSTSTGVQIVYDGDGNRVSETAAGVITKFLVDEFNPTHYPQVAEEIIGTTVNAQYVYGWMRISQRRTGGVVSYYGYDAGGSTRQLLSSTGAVTDTYAYDAFGNTVTQTGSTVNEFLYRGEQFDAGLGMYYLRARYYVPRTGRFLSADKYEGQEAGACDCATSKSRVAAIGPHNIFAYGKSDPVDLVDPSGKFSLVERALLLTIAVAATYEFIYYSQHNFKPPFVPQDLKRGSESDICADQWFEDMGKYVDGMGLGFEVAKVMADAKYFLCRIALTAPWN
jgi:RHS repeat-associated protein